MPFTRSFKTPKGIIGWAVLLFWIAVEILDWWDRGESVLGKLRRLGPYMPNILEVLTSPVLRISLVLLGLLLIWLSSRNTRPKVVTPAAALDKLVRLKKEGDRLYMQPLMAHQLPEWSDRRAAWWNAVIGYLENHFTTADANKIEHPREALPPSDNRGINEVHIELRRELGLWLKILDQILNDYRRKR
jgi:hypothetical protein